MLRRQIARTSLEMIDRDARESRGLSHFGLSEAQSPASPPRLCGRHCNSTLRRAWWRLQEISRYFVTVFSSLFRSFIG
jgi:hypothetical protein